MRSSLAASTLTCCSLVALLAGGPAASEYQGPDYAKLKALLSPGQDAASCYARRYSAEHLKQHPKQKVTEMMLFLRYVTLGEDDAILISTDNGDTSKQYFRYDFTLAAKVRDHSQTLYASGDCASAEGIGCGVDCDGGGIEIEPVAGKNGTILVRLARIRMTLGCSEGPEIDLEAGADDKLFKLTQISATLCQSMQADAEK